MRLLTITQNVIAITKFLFTVSSVLTIFFVAFSPVSENNFVNYKYFTFSLNDPHYEISSDELQYSLTQKLPQQENLRLTVDQVNFKLPINMTYKLITLFLILVVVVIIYLLLDALQKIVQSIESSQAFNMSNAKRLKIIGMLVLISPIIEFVIEYISFWWINKSYELPGLTLTSDTQLGWFTFLIGLVIYTIGIAFQQGLKLQEEQNLTI